MENDIFDQVAKEADNLADGLKLIALAALNKSAELPCIALNLVRSSYDIDKLVKKITEYQVRTFVTS